MILGFGLTLIAAGFIMGNIDMFMPPVPEMIVMVYSLKWMGIGLVIIGMIVIGGRSIQTNAGIWFDIPSVNRVIAIHSGISGKRLDPNAKFMICKDIGLGILKARKKVFKDTGGGFRICGHDVRRTHEKLGADLPEWIGQYFHMIKKKYKIRGEKEMRELYSDLKGLHDPVPGVSIMRQLETIESLKPALKDEKTKRLIEKMDIDELRNMTEYLFDGETVHMEDVENFLKLASPNELDTWIQQEMTLNELEKRTYREPGVPIDWNKWLPALGLFMIIAILGTVILISYLG